MGTTRVWLKAQKISFLKSIELFKQVREEQLTPLADCMEPMEITTGTVLVKQGKVDTRLFILVEGKLQIENESTTECLETGSTFGVMSCLTAQPASQTVIATQDSIVFFLEHDDLFTTIAGSEELARSLIFSLSQKIQYLEAQVN